MCFYDMVCYACGDWRWDKFRQRCSQEYRIGETCGRRLVGTSIPMANKCKICEKLEAKVRRRTAEYERVLRWQREGGKFKASIEKSIATIRELDIDIQRLAAQRTQNVPGALGGRR
ncbi:hypothetical protein KVT40_000508 [Elsinoe batatas]|uniref:Uncharacterized protein n=1 Tax=Elsinoe batatas TaxID=2601811 RepID=A0A8K0LB32_9PEZI|nr:hypothetical protein KVT40_000508 [Elsinoe batatas]